MYLLHSSTFQSGVMASRSLTVGAAAVATTLHLAPTEHSANNLRREGYAEPTILVVGNTIVDAVQRIHGPRVSVPVVNQVPLVLVTLHRRESFGEPIARVLDALKTLAIERTGKLKIVYPVHPNPKVDGPARAALANVPGVELHAPMDYPEFLRLFGQARFVMSDSGGVQEEGPSLSVPVLVLRETTERPEVISSGWGKLVGTDRDLILTEARRLLDDDDALAEMKRGANPFGDGHAADRIVHALWQGLAGR